MIAGMQAVYTALIGRYERLNEQPVAARSSIPFICFTDDTSLVSDTWKVELVEPAFARDPVRSARRLKILGHERLGEFAETLWIDNALVLESPPEHILGDWLDSADVALPRHSFRARLIDEFEAVVEAGYDDPARVYEQLHHYLDAVPDLLSRQPLWTAFLARRSCPEVAAFGQRWYEQVLRYSRRDQLSVLLALARSPELRTRVVDLDNNGSSLHRWPVTVERDRSGPLRDPLEALKPLVLRVHGLERTIDALQARATTAEARAEALEEELGRATAEGAAAADARDHLRAQVDAVERSRSWKLARLISRVLRPAARVADRVRAR